MGFLFPVAQWFLFSMFNGSNFPVLTSFKKIAKQYMPEYDNHQLFLNGKLYLNYQESHDETQFV